MEHYTVHIRFTENSFEGSIQKILRRGVQGSSQDQWLAMCPRSRKRNLKNIFGAHLVYRQQGRSDHLFSAVARAARCPEKNGKTREPSKIKVRGPSSGLMIGLEGSASHGFIIFTLSFYLSSLAFLLPVQSPLHVCVCTFRLRQTQQRKAPLLERNPRWTRDWIRLWSTCGT